MTDLTPVITDMSPVNSPELRDGKFVKGQSGNPSGKPKGAINKTTKIAMGLLDGELEAITQKAIDLALGGDMQAIKLILERVIPARKDRPVNIDLPEINCSDDIASANKLIIEAVSNAELTPAEGQTLMSFLDNMKKAMKENAIDNAFGNGWW